MSHTKADIIGRAKFSIPLFVGSRFAYAYEESASVSNIRIGKIKGVEYNSKNGQPFKLGPRALIQWEDGSNPYPEKIYLSTAHRWLVL